MNNPETRANYIEHTVKDGKIIRTRVNARTEAELREQIDSVPPSSYVMIKFFTKDGRMIVARGNDRGNMKSASHMNAAIAEYMAKGQSWYQAFLNYVACGFDFDKDLSRRHLDDSLEWPVLPDSSDVSNFVMYITY